MSSKHHHKHKHHHSQASETKSASFSRKFLSFILFTLIFTLGVTVCLRSVVLNPNELASCLTDKEYSNSVFLDAQQYAYDLCDQCSIPRECVDDVISYDTISEINESYIVGNLCSDERFTSSTYADKLEELNKNLNKSIKNELNSRKISVDASQKNRGIKSFSQKIVNYINDIVEIEYIEQVQTLTNVGKVGIIALMASSILFSILIILAILSIGKKRYRCVRAISYSFIATGLLNFILIIGVEIVKKTKSLYIFPTYLCDAAMRYVADCEGAFFGAGAAAMAVAVMLVVVGWKLKRDDK